MFDIGLQEMLLIGVIALLVFGPERMPELGRKLGRLMREFRRASDDFRSTVETNLHLNEPEPLPASPPVESTVSAEPAAVAPLPSELEPADAFEATGDSAVNGLPHVESGEPFCARRGSRLFHRRECSWTRGIPEVDRLFFKRVAEAREQGLVTCPVCEPWEVA